MEHLQPRPILIVEDNADTAFLEKYCLEQAGFNVEVAVNAREALDLVGRKEYDIMLLDYNLPDSNRLSTLERLGVEGHDVAVVLVTAHGNEQLAAEAMHRGARDYVIKGSMFLEDLPQAVTRVLRQVDAERRLREAEAKYRDLYDNAPDGYHSVDAHMVLVEINQTELDRLGYTREELIGHRRLFDLVTSASQETLRQAYPSLLATGRMTNLELEFLRKEGTSFPVRLNARRLTDPQGNTTIIHCTVREITQERILQQQLLQAQKLESIRMLAGGIAHDFNNILMGILGIADLALMDLSPEHPMAKDFEQIQALAKRASRLTHKLLAFARRQVLEPKRMNLNEVISDTHRLLERIIPANIEIKVQKAPDLAIIRADLAQIEQIVMNLCINARDAMPEGGTLCIETRNVELDEAFCHDKGWGRPGRYALLHITDTGTGMDSATLQHIFEPFFTTKESTQSTGLGLAVVYGIVKQHDGFIQADSRPGSGTTFKIYLPAMSPEILNMDRGDREPPAGMPSTSASHPNS